MIEVLFHISLLSILAIMFYQDLKLRAIYWILFPLLFLILLIRNLYHTNIEDLLEAVLYNFGYILLIFLSMKAFFSFLRGKQTKIIDRVMGTGDVFFLIALAVFFSPFNFILFFVLSKLIVILIVAIHNLVREKQMRKVPLAGFQAAILMILYIYNLYSGKIEFSSDEWLVDYLV